MKRSVIAAGLGLAFVMAGAGAGSAAVTGTPVPSVAVAQCNGDPGFDASNDPVRCHYRHLGHHHHGHF